MAKIESYTPGSFCWAELLTNDVASAKSFYTTVFKWSVQEVPVPGGTYTMFLSEEGNLAAAAAGSPPGVPPSWGLYFSVESADASHQKALELGGTSMVAPFDVMDAGRMAVLQDPQGTVFSIWQAGRHIGATHGGPLYMPTWPEVYTRDPLATAAFYGSLFGWKTKPEAGLDTAEYAEWIHHGASMGGMLAMRGPMWDHVPAHWMMYVTVPDCDAAAAQIKGNGGGIRMGPRDIPNVGRFAVVHDAQGAGFSIIQLRGATAGA